MGNDSYNEVISTLRSIPLTVLNQRMEFMKLNFNELIIFKSWNLAIKLVYSLCIFYWLNPTSNLNLFCFCRVPRSTFTRSSRRWSFTRSQWSFRYQLWQSVVIQCNNVIIRLVCSNLGSFSGPESLFHM